jgi:hypothetical protein
VCATGLQFGARSVAQAGLRLAPAASMDALHSRACATARNAVGRERAQSGTHTHSHVIPQGRDRLAGRSQVEDANVIRRPKRPANQRPAAGSSSTATGFRNVADWAVSAQTAASARGRGNATVLATALRRVAFVRSDRTLMAEAILSPALTDPRRSLSPVAKRVCAYPKLRAVGARRFSRQERSRAGR